jgi:hypothetical protein
MSAVSASRPHHKQPPHPSSIHGHIIMSKRERKRYPVEARPDTTATKWVKAAEVKVQPLPVWSHPEFNVFMEQYSAYVDRQINTFIVLYSYVENDYTRHELAHWKSVKKSLKHIHWMGTRKNDR